MDTDNWAPSPASDGAAEGAVAQKNLHDIALRLRSLREDVGVSTGEMAKALGVSLADYDELETGAVDFSFTMLYHAANKLGVDMIDLLTGEGPHLSGCSIVRAGQGLSIKRHEGFEYLHLAPTFKDKLAEMFVVTAPYSAEEQGKPIELSQHEGQEFDFILSGRLRFAYEDALETHINELDPGDALLYDSGHGHGMIATGGETCTFLAVVFKPQN